MTIEFQKKILPNLRWYMMPGNFLNPNIHHELYEKTYQHWKQMWTKILNVGKNLNSDTFIRQDILCPLVYKKDVIGLIGCNFFNLKQEATKDHSYTSVFPKEQLANFSEDNSISMSIEYLTVSPDFRKSIIHISLGDILLGLSMKVFANSNASFVLGTARSKIHVDKMCYQFGFQPFGEIDKFGHPCTLIINTKKTLTNHSNLAVHSCINKLWLGRENVLNNNNIMPIAA